jgi:hypothetical protein
MSESRASVAPDDCFACGRAMKRPEFVFTQDTRSDGKHYEVHVGPECFKHVQAAGDVGYQPPAGGPRLFLSAAAATAALPGTYVIQERGGAFVRRAPTVGTWYCGFEADEQYAEAGVGYTGPDGKLGWRDGAIAQYAGDGRFYDEHDSERDFGRYDWIAEQ